MKTQIYGVVLNGGEKERRYYGDCESQSQAEHACNLLVDSCQVDYAYAKQIGVGTVFYRVSTDYEYKAQSLPSENNDGSTAAPATPA